MMKLYATYHRGTRILRAEVETDLGLSGAMSAQYTIYVDEIFARLALPALVEKRLENRFIEQFRHVIHVTDDDHVREPN